MDTLSLRHSKCISTGCPLQPSCLSLGIRCDKVHVAAVPTNAKERKALPICTGVLDYFPDALLEIARVSKAGNDQHNPGQPLHWARGKSRDHADAQVRHILDRGKIDSDGQRHSAKAAWRALALLQEEIEQDRNPEGF